MCNAQKIVNIVLRLFKSECHDQHSRQQSNIEITFISSIDNFDDLFLNDFSWQLITNFSIHLDETPRTISVMIIGSCHLIVNISNIWDVAKIYLWDWYSQISQISGILSWGVWGGRRSWGVSGRLGGGC